MTRLHGRALVTAMSLAQLGSLLPHGAVHGIMAGDLMPLWGLSAAHAGLMASGRGASGPVARMSDSDMRAPPCPGIIHHPAESSSSARIFLSSSRRE